LFIDKLLFEKEVGLFLLLKFVEFGSEFLSIGLGQELLGGFRNFGFEIDVFSVPVVLGSVGSFSSGFLLLVVVLLFRLVIVFGLFGLFMLGRLLFWFFLFGLRLEFLLVLGLLGNGLCGVNEPLFDVLLGDEPWHLDCIRKKNYKTWIIKFKVG
jgi:hypothetical protein